MHRILLVEDEEHIQQALKLNLELEGYYVYASANGLDAIAAFREQKFDLVILDIMLPEMDGLMVCEHIRLHNTDVPVLFLSAKNTPADRIQGLRKGADDYITKPFDLEELLLRVKKLIEKNVKLQQTSENKLSLVVEFGKNWINFESYEAFGVQGKISLTKKEILLMKLLIENKNQVVSREHILKVVWDYNVIPNTRTIDNFVLALRKYFEKDPKNPVFIQSVRGVGYKFVA
ncbi:MAG: response regulator transcription factor [Bacteroidota bacterium]|jgi:two-component system alkaline phosphatase synthesis response regulator PhoP